MNYYAMPADKVLDQLGSSAGGLSSDEAKARLAKYGPNEFARKKAVSLLSIFIGQFKSLIVLILIVAVIISAALGEVVDAVVISVILVFNAVFGTFQEFRAERAMEALASLASPTAKVIRNGKKQVVPASELVPGDVIVIETGDSVPADARIIEGMCLNCDEASLTGESLPSGKDVKPLREGTALGDRDNMAFMHTIASSGHGLAVVTATGMQTEMGKIATMIQSIEEEATPMQKRLEELGRKLGLLVLGICALIFLLQAAETPGILGNPLGHIEELTFLFMVAVSLAVAAIPEGLPAVVTITLAIGLQRMARRNALIRKLPAVETLGSTTVICSDKTGTLTKNQMTVREIATLTKVVTVSGAGYEPKGEFSDELNDDIRLLFQTGIYCNDATLDEDNGNWKIMGDPTEGALIVVANKAGVMGEEWRRVDELSFDSQRKRMTTINQTPQGLVAFTKGAPEGMLSVCSRILVDGKERKITDRDKRLMIVKNNEMAGRALRVLGFAYKKLPKQYEKQKVEADLVFIGLMGMIDPPHDEAHAAINACERAGIKVVMITGDNAITAEAIATELGIMRKGQRVLIGEQLEKMSAAELSKIVEEVAVYARVAPEHKLKIVDALQARGHVVAMTGDGVNDAPALKSADIGIAMGVTGTDVAKGAAAMILRDDNFSTIVAAIEEGRRIFDNIRNFLKYLLSANIAEVIAVTLASIAGLPIIFLPVQLLWMNLVTDGLPALALGTDPPDPTAMSKKPRRKGESMFEGMTGTIVLIGVLGAVASMIAFLYGYGTAMAFGGAAFAEAKARTMALTALVLFELVLVFNCREPAQSMLRGGLLSNKWLLAAVALSFMLQLAIIYIPFFQPLFSMYPLALSDWPIIIAVAGFATTPFVGNMWARKESG